MKIFEAIILDFVIRVHFQLRLCRPHIANSESIIFSIYLNGIDFGKLHNSESSNETLSIHCDRISQWCLPIDSIIL